MNVDIKKLNKPALIKFNEFLVKQIDLTSKRKIFPVFRGDKLENLYKRLGLLYNEKNRNHQILLDRLFMIGEKSRHFYEDAFFSSSKDAIKISECNKRVFDYIFDRLNSATKNKTYNATTFFSKDQIFKKYFQDKKANKTTFTATLLTINSMEQFLFRNYYLKLLHQLNDIHYKNKSHLISTSKSTQVASTFAVSKSAEKSIKLHAWTPAIKQINFSEFDLPVYNRLPYPNQFEVSILAGILPHYIIGLEIIEDAQFFINPNILKSTINDNLFYYGINIDQSKFDETLKKTRYKRSYQVKGNIINER